MDWTQNTDGNYTASANNDTLSVAATTFATTNELSKDCYGLKISVTGSDGVSTDYTAPGTFFSSADWGGLACDMYLPRALEGKTGEDLFKHDEEPLA